MPRNALSWQPHAHSCLFAPHLVVRRGELVRPHAMRDGALPLTAAVATARAAASVVLHHAPGRLPDLTAALRLARALPPPPRDAPLHPLHLGGRAATLAHGRRGGRAAALAAVGRHLYVPPRALPFFGPRACVCCERPASRAAPPAARRPVRGRRAAHEPPPAPRRAAADTSSVATAVPADSLASACDVPTALGTSAAAPRVTTRHDAPNRTGTKQHHTTNAADGRTAGRARRNTRRAARC